MALFKKDPGDILDADGAARLLKVSREGFLGALERDTLPARKIGGEWRLSRGALMQWLADGSSRTYTGEIFTKLTPFNLSQAEKHALWRI